jgi:hypothetical protein
VSKKVFVCKFVGTPGIDERLQTGQNPISVSVNAIPNWSGTIGEFFADAQGRSLVIAFDIGQPEPGVGMPPGPRRRRRVHRRLLTIHDAARKHNVDLTTSTSLTTSSTTQDVPPTHYNDNQPQHVVLQRAARHHPR